MKDEEDENSGAIQAALEQVMREQGGLPEDAILTGWIVAYEYRTGDDAFAGQVYGPESNTAWTALGLLDWARRIIHLRMADDDEEDDD